MQTEIKKSELLIRIKADDKFEFITLIAILERHFIPNIKESTKIYSKKL